MKKIFRILSVFILIIALALFVWFIFHFSFSNIGILYFALTIAIAAFIWGGTGGWTLPKIGPRLFGIPIERLITYCFFFPVFYLSLYKFSKISGRFLTIAIIINVFGIFTEWFLDRKYLN